MQSRLDVPIPDGNLVTTDHRVLSAVMLFIRIHVRSRFTQDYRPGAFSAVPSGLVRDVNSTQDYVLGYSQPSLSGLIASCPGS
jgi:hypothetical protein